jgi:hypothetical protein
MEHCTSDPTDFANIQPCCGVVGSGSVTVKDERLSKGTFAGFVIRFGTLALVNLLQSLTIETYNDGVLQESKSAGQLIDLSLRIRRFGFCSGNYDVVLKLRFDEIRLTLNSILA